MEAKTRCGVGQFGRITWKKMRKRHSNEIPFEEGDILLIKKINICINKGGDQKMFPFQ